MDKFPEGIVDVEDVVLYPSLAAEYPGVVLGQDQPLPSIEEELVPQGRAEDAAACNANLQPFDVAGVVAAPIVHANADKLDDYESDDDDGIIAIGVIPQQPPHAPLEINDTDDDDDEAATEASDDDNDNDNNNDNDDNGDDIDEDEDNDDSSDEEDNDEPAAATDAQERNESDGDQGVRRLQRRGKGTSEKYAD